MLALYEITYINTTDGMPTGEIDMIDIEAEDMEQACQAFSDRFMDSLLLDVTRSLD